MLWLNPHEYGTMTYKFPSDISDHIFGFSVSLVERKRTYLHLSQKASEHMVCMTRGLIYRVLVSHFLRFSHRVAVV